MTSRDVTCDITPVTVSVCENLVNTGFYVTCLSLSLYRCRDYDIKDKVELCDDRYVGFYTIDIDDIINNILSVRNKAL